MTARSTLLKVLAAIFVVAPLAFAQQGQGAALPNAYDVVSIKLESQDPPSVGIRYTATGFEAYAVSLTDLIKEAYGLPDWRLVKGAAGIKTKYHIVAKLSDADAKTLSALSAKDLTAERQRLLQAVLAQRFALVVHHTKSPLPVYSLEVGKRGLRLHEVMPGSAGASNQAQLTVNSSFSDGRIMGVFSMERLAHILSLLHKLNSDGSDRVVVDETGLSGRYVVDLAWTGPTVSRPPMVSETTEVYGSVNSALEAVGLRLVAKTIDADSVVVDHAGEASLD